MRLCAVTSVTGGVIPIVSAHSEDQLVREFAVQAPDGRVYRAGEYPMPGGGTRCVLIGRRLELYRDGPGRYRLQDGTLMRELPP